MRRPIRVLPDSGWRNILRRVPPDSVLYLPGLDYGSWYTGTIKDFSSEGKTSKAGETQQQIDANSYAGSDTVYTATGLTLTVPENLSGVRIKFDLSQGIAGQTAYGKLYKNGVAFGTERTTVLDTWTTFSEDFANLVSGDVITVKAKTEAGVGNAWSAQNLTICYDWLKNDGTILGATTKILPSGLPYLDFDGTDDRVDCGTSGILTLTSGTVLFWVKSSWATADMILSASDKDTNAVDEVQFQVRAGETRLLFVTRTASANVQELTTPDGSLTPGKWTHCGYRSNGTLISMLIDGVPQTITIDSGVNNGDWFGDVPNLDNLTMGILRRSLGNVASLLGGIALLLVTSAFLADSQVANHYSQTRHLFL